MVQSKSERSRQQKHRDWLLLGDANRQRIRDIEKRLAYPPADSNLTRIYHFRSDRISEDWKYLDVHHAPTAEEVTDFDHALILDVAHAKLNGPAPTGLRVPVMLLIDNGNFIDLESPNGRFTLGFDTYGRRVFFVVLNELSEHDLITLKADATVTLPEGWKR